MPTTQSLYNSFVRSRKALGRSPRTIEGYDIALQHFNHFISTELDHDDINAINRHVVQDFIIEHMAAGRTTTTANKTFRALRSFFNWCYEEDLIAQNPFARLKAPPARPKPKTGYQTREIQAIVDNLLDESYSPGREGFLAIRDYAIILTLYDTGLRASEILAMTVEGLDHTNQEFEVPGKGGRTYRRHLGDQATYAINLYLDKSQVIRGTPLTGNMWRNHSGYLFTKSGLYRMCRYRADQAGIRNGDVHRWRYTHAEVLDEMGWPEEVIMAEMGHSQRSVSRHYRQASIRRQALTLHAANSPADRLGKDIA